MLSFSTLLKVINEKQDNVLITAGKTASQVLKGWELENTKFFKEIEPTRVDIETKFQQGLTLNFIIRHPAHRYISGIKEIVLNHSLIDLGNLLRRQSKTNISEVIELDTMLAYWHTAEAWEYALHEVFDFWQSGYKNGVTNIDYSFNEDYHVGNWLGIIDEFMQMADTHNLDNLRIVELNDLSYFGAKEFNVLFPIHHVSPLSSHVDDIVFNILGGKEDFDVFIEPEQALYKKLCNSRFFYKVDNNHPRNEHSYYEFY